MGDDIEQKVSAAVEAWLRWVPKWEPGTHRVRARLCRRCTGSPLLIAANLPGDTPHQVSHALVSRLQKIIDMRVNAYTEAHLPALHAELTGAELWSSGGFDPTAGLEPEYEGLDLDPELDANDQPFLFTMMELAEVSRPAPPLPRPPLSAEEKQRLRSEIELADACADEAGQQVCFALVGHRSAIASAIHRFVEPQVTAMLDELSRQLQPPNSGG